MLINPIKFYRPQTIQEAAELYSSLDSVKLLAGGTFVVNNLKSSKKAGRKTNDNLISLKGINELKGSSLSKGSLTINSMATITEIFEFSGLKDNLSVLKDACSTLGTTQIRNMATIGGNIACRYTWTELPAVLIALEATLNFADKNNKPKSMSAEEFFLNSAKTDDILTSIVIEHDTDSFCSYQRFTRSAAIDLPLGALCIRTDIASGCFSNTKVVLNTTNSFPKRDSTLEAFLNGKKAADNIADSALNNIDENILGKLNNEYQEHMFRISIKNAVKNIIKDLKTK
ncbi:MAG: FAD binding domain-containing protein [Candidatus Omnitrophica bacterium]|nr:FAD binding domain-containing protein [Candidatus Omnitrophota bacterium]